MNKYEQLTQDLIDSAAEAQQFALANDGGTCNFDSPTVRLERWNKEQLINAVKNAGLNCFYCKFFKSWVITGGTSGQGNRRTTMAEAIKDSLKKRGYDASMYYQMD